MVHLLAQTTQPTPTDWYAIGEHIALVLLGLYSVYKTYAHARDKAVLASTAAAHSDLIDRVGDAIELLDKVFPPHRIVTSDSPRTNPLPPPVSTP